MCSSRTFAGLRCVDTWYYATKEERRWERAKRAKNEAKEREGGEKWIVPGGLGYRIRPVDRATFYPKVLRASVRNSRVQSIPVFRFTNGYQKLRRMNFYSKRWRERERETVSPRESSFIVRDSVPRERERKYKVRFILWVSIRNGNGYSAFRKDFVLHRIELRKK